MIKKKEISLTQKEVIDFSLDSLHEYKQVYIDLEMGMGKTFLVGSLLQKMVQNSKVKVLYICPSSLIHQSSTELKNEFPKLDITYKSYSFFQDLEFVLSQMPSANSFDIVVLDEAHKIKSFSNSILSQADMPLEDFVKILKNYNKFPYVKVSIGTLKYIENIKYKIFMSGTPMPLGAIDIFNFLWLGKIRKFISNPYSRQESYFNFTNTYSIKKATPQGVSYSGFNRKNFDTLIKNLSCCYISREHKDEKSEHLKIPTPIDEVVTLNDTTINQINEENRIIEILQKFYNVNSENFFSILKTTPQFKQLHALRRAVGLSKIDFTLDFVKKLGKKVIVFFQFRENATIFFNQVQKFRKNCILLTGEKSIKKTSRELEIANSLDECVIIATMAKLGTGFDCKTFEEIVFVELDMNFAIVAQARGRFLRKGITFTPHAYYITYPIGVDKMIINNLLSKNFKPLRKLK